MHFFLKIFIITALLSSGISFGFKNYKNPNLSMENAEEISAESKEKSDLEDEDSFASLFPTNHTEVLNYLASTDFHNEKKLHKFLEEVPTSPPNS